MQLTPTQGAQNNPPIFPPLLNRDTISIIFSHFHPSSKDMNNFSLTCKTWKEVSLRAYEKWPTIIRDKLCQRYTLSEYQNCSPHLLFPSSSTYFLKETFEKHPKLLSKEENEKTLIERNEFEMAFAYVISKKCTNVFACFIRNFIKERSFHNCLKIGLNLLPFKESSNSARINMYYAVFCSEFVQKGLTHMGDLKDLTEEKLSALKQHPFLLSLEEFKKHKVFLESGPLCSLIQKVVQPLHFMTITTESSRAIRNCFIKEIIESTTFSYATLPQNSMLSYYLSIDSIGFFKCNSFDGFALNRTSESGFEYINPELDCLDSKINAEKKEDLIEFLRPIPEPFGENIFLETLKLCHKNWGENSPDRAIISSIIQELGYNQSLFDSGS